MNEDLDKFMTDVMHAASVECGVRLSDLKKHTRKGPIVMARYMAYKIIFDHTDHLRHPNGVRQITLADLGRIMGGFDHATVLHAIRTVSQAIGKTKDIPPHPKWKRAYENILERLKPALEMEVLSSGAFFPYTKEGYIKAKDFLWDLGEYTLREEAHDMVIFHANKLLNKYKA